MLMKNIVKKTEKAGKWQKSYLFISNYREKVVLSTVCDVVTETLLQLLFEGVKQGEVFKSSLHTVTLCMKRSKDGIDL